MKEGRKFDQHGHYIGGAKDSPLDIRDYRYELRAAMPTFPEQFLIKPKSILNQGSVGSCVAHSLASLLENVLNKQFSTGWVYGYRPPIKGKDSDRDMQEGMYLREACNTLLKMGNVIYTTFPENIEVKPAVYLVDDRFDNLKNEAIKQKIKSYVNLGNGNNDTSRLQAKSWLYNNKMPILFSCNVYSGWYHNPFIKDTKVIIRAGENLGGHAMIILGWNKYGWIIQNSWGKNWNLGDNGIATLSYDYPLKELWGVEVERTDIPENERPIIIKPTKLKIFIQKIISFFQKLFKK